MQSWTLADTIECYRQGFGVFYQCDGSYAIQKLDDSDEIAYSYDIEILRSFESDDEAIEWVKQSHDPLCVKVKSFLESNGCSLPGGNDASIKRDTI